MAEMKHADIRPPEDSANLVVNLVEAVGKKILESGRNITIGEKIEILSSVAQLRLIFDAFSDLVKSLQLSPDKKDSIFKYLAILMTHGFSIGQSSLAIPQIQKHLRDLQAASMRHKRSTAPEKIALLNAIKDIRGDGPCEHPWKEAVSILGLVNENLESQGYKPVKVDVVYRRLQKFPRS